MLSLSEFKNKMQNEANVQWLASTELEMFWSFDVKLPSDQLWQYISDTSRFNREMGLSARTEEEVEGKLIISTTLVGFPQKWIEEPWMWIEGQTIKSERTYLKGVARTVQAVFHLEPLSNENTRVYIYFGWNPSNAICKWFLSSTQNILKSKFNEAFAKIEKYYSENSKHEKVGAFKKLNNAVSDEQKNKLKSIRNSILEKGVDEKLLDKFCQYILQGDEIELDNIKVMRLAYDWSIDYKELLKICLYGSKLGMLNISWNLICPHCKGARSSALNLGGIQSQSSCEPCGITFTADAPNAVEIVFKIHPSVRTIPNVSYCAAEPAKKSHIKVQQKVLPGTKLILNAPAISGAYRFRLKNNDHDFIIKVSKSAERTTLEIDSNFNVDRIAVIGLGSKIDFTNLSTQEAVINLEQLEFSDYSLRPQHLLFYPEFKELFAEEHLKSDVKLHLGSQSLLFTDVVGSTAYYDKVGDAKAFDEVRRHFIDTFEIVKRHKGEVVKTIGDAVMATFPTTEQAFNCSVEIQNKFDGKRNDLSLRLRISIHTGVVIAVYLESGMDYFGSAINKCAKIQSQAGAGEVVMTEEIWQSLRPQIEKFSFTDKVYGADSSHPQKTKVLQIS